MQQCNFEGQGTCRICESTKGFNRYWGCFLYKVDGYDGCYCYEHAKELEERAKELTNKTN